MFSLFVTVASVSLTITSVLMQSKVQIWYRAACFQRKEYYLILTKCPSASQVVQLGLHLFKDKIFGRFPGSTVLKNLPANAGEVGSIPDPRRSHRYPNN